VKNEVSGSRELEVQRRSSGATRGSVPDRYRPTAYTATHVAFKAASVVVDTVLDAAEGMKRLRCTVVPDDTAMHAFCHATQFEVMQRVPPKLMHKLRGHPDEVEFQRAMKRELEYIQEFGCMGDTPCALSVMSYDATVMPHM
jgi:hypothetical protein